MEYSTHPPLDIIGRQTAAAHKVSDKETAVMGTFMAVKSRRVRLAGYVEHLRRRETIIAENLRPFKKPRRR